MIYLKINAYNWYACVDNILGTSITTTLHYVLLGKNRGIKITIAQNFPGNKATNDSEILSKEAHAQVSITYL